MLLAPHESVITYFVQAEILASDWHPRQRSRIGRFLRAAEFLLPPSADAIQDYAQLKRSSVALGLRYGAEREDLWMLAQSRSEGLPVVTNDRNAARVARASGMTVLTELLAIEEDYARDRQRLERLQRY